MICVSHHTVRERLLLHMQALTTPPSQLGLTDTGTPGLQLAVACAASLYFLRQNKRLGLGEYGCPVVLPLHSAFCDHSGEAAAAGPMAAALFTSSLSMRCLKRRADAC